MIDYNLALMTGADIPISEYQLVLHQPSIKEISMMGEKDFFIALQFLCLNKESLIQNQALLNQITNFQIFLTVLTENELSKQLNVPINLKENIIQFLVLLFKGYKIYFTPQSIILNSEEQTVTIDNDNFYILQELIKRIFCVNTSILGDKGVFNPKGSKAREIADKLMRARQRVAAQKEGDDSSVFVRYLSILTIGLHIDLNSLRELTVYQIYDLIERYNLYLDWDIDLKVRLAGGDPKSQAESFMKELH